MNEKYFEKDQQKEFPTLKGDSDKKSDALKFKEYQIKGNDNELYNLKIVLFDKCILFNVRDILDFRKIIYKNEILLEEFYNLNRFFRQYLSLEELFNFFLNNLQNSEISISKEKENNIKLTFIVECRGEEKEIPFILNQEQLTLENIVDNLSEKIKEIENQSELNKNILNQLNEYKNNMNNINNRNNCNKSSLSTLIFNFFIINKVSLIILLLSLLTEWMNIKYLKKEIYNLKNVIKELGNKNINSRIIGDNELYLIEDDIQKLYNKKIIKYELIFRASRDGYKAKDFHNKCDGINNTITFIKSKDGKRFGGFMDFPLNKDNYYNNKVNSFVFDLNELEIYYNKEDNQIYNNNYDYNYGPIFEGNKGFKISNNCDINKNYFNLIHTKHNRYNSDRVNIVYNQNNYFYCRDYEVYKIYFD